MNNIIIPNETFDFSKLQLTHPVAIQGGAYFTKIEYNNKPLYIQTTKSLTKQGFVKNGKKYHCDLMFDTSSPTLIQWFETLEETCQKLIFSKKDDWFQGSLEESDVESAFNSLLRVYKSGKYYLLRTLIKNTKTDTPAVKIYDENEVNLDMTSVTAETEIISILHIHGIKFTTRNFQIEVELKQVMLVNKEPIFDSCLIKPTNQTMAATVPTSNNLENINPIVHDRDETLDNHNTDYTIEDVFSTSTNNDFTGQNDVDIEEPKNTTNIINNGHILNLGLEEMDVQKEVCETTDTHDTPNATTNQIELDTDHDTKEHKINDKKENIQNNKKEDIVQIEFEELEENQPPFFENDELREIENDDVFANEITEESMTLKKPEQVYYDLYKAAKQKAKLAKRNAIIAYLEAKNIKKTYLIDTINDSDSDFDAEIDDVSESELDGF
jgi:hypothetical protein